MKRTVCAVDEGTSAQEPDAKRPKVEEYESESVLQLDIQEFECVICADLMVDPVVGRCGHDFCKGCLEDWLYRNKHKPHCPVCRTYLGSSQEEHGVCLRLKELVEKLFPRRSKDRRKEVEKQTAELKRRRKQEEQQQRREQEQRRAAYAAAMAGGHGYGYGFHMSGRQIEDEVRRMRAHLEGAYRGWRGSEHQADGARRGAAAEAAGGAADPGVAATRDESPAIQLQRVVRTRRSAAAAAAAARGQPHRSTGASAGRGQVRQVLEPTNVWGAARRDAGAAPAATAGEAAVSAAVLPRTAGRQGEQQGPGLQSDSDLSLPDRLQALQAHAYRQHEPQDQQRREQQVQRGIQQVHRSIQHMQDYTWQPPRLPRSGLAGLSRASGLDRLDGLEGLDDWPDAIALAIGPAAHVARDATTQVDAAAAPQAAAAGVATTGVDSSRHHRDAGHTTAAAAGLEAVDPLSRLFHDDWDLPWGTSDMNDSPAERAPQQPPGGDNPPARPLSATAVAAAATAVAPVEAPAAQLPAAAAGEPAVAEGDTAQLVRATNESLAQHTQARPVVPGQRAGDAAALGRVSDRPRDQSAVAIAWQTDQPGVLPDLAGVPVDDDLLTLALIEDAFNPDSQTRAPALPSDAAVVAAAAADDDDADSGRRRAGDETADSGRRRVTHQPPLTRTEARIRTRAAAAAAAQARLQLRQNERVGLRRAAMGMSSRALGAADLTAPAAAGAEEENPARAAAQPALVTSTAADAERTGTDPAADSVAEGVTAAGAVPASMAGAGADADRVELAAGWGATYPRNHRDSWMRQIQDDWCPPLRQLPPASFPSLAGGLSSGHWPHSEREAQEVAREVAGAAGEPPTAAAAAGRTAAAAGRTAVSRRTAIALAGRTAAAPGWTAAGQGAAPAAGDRDQGQTSGGQVAVKREHPTATGSDSDEYPAIPPAAAATAAADDMPSQQQQQRRLGFRSRAADDNPRRRGAFLDMMGSRAGGAAWFWPAEGAAVRSPAAAETALDTVIHTARAARAARDHGLVQRAPGMGYVIPTPQGYVGDSGVSDLDPSDAEGSNRPAQAPEEAEPLPPAAAAAGGGGNSRAAAAPAAEQQDTTQAQGRLQSSRLRFAMAHGIGRRPQRTPAENQVRRADPAPPPSEVLVPPTAPAVGLAPAESAELAEEVARATARHVRREVEGILTGSLPRRHAGPPPAAAVVVDGGYISSSSDQE